MEFTSSRKVKKPLQVRVVLVRPEYSMNVGMVARAAKNFSVTDLALVYPKCKVDFEAFKYAKHSQEVLGKARVFPSLEKAVAGFDVVVATTGVLRRFGSSLKTCIPLSQLSGLVKGRKVALVFGPEGTGLSDREFQQCDLVTHIPAEKAHPVLNLSHAVAVILYALYFSAKQKTLYKKTSASEIAYLNDLFGQIVDKLGQRTLPSLRDPHKAKVAFRRLVGRAAPSSGEVQTLLGVFSRMKKLLHLK